MNREKDTEELVIAANQKIKERDFWLDKLSADWVKSIFPYDFKDRSGDHKKPSAAGGEGVNKVEFRFPEELFIAVHKLSGASDTRTHMILLAGVVILLNKYSYNNTPGIIVGIPTYRQQVKGEFINTVLPIRCHLDKNISFKDFLLRVRDAVAEAVENRNYPVEILVRNLNLPFSEDTDFPLFDAAVLLENIHDKEDLAHIRHNITFSFCREGERYLRGEVLYNRLLYKKDTIERLIGHLINFLQRALRNTNAAVSNIDILSDEEKKTLAFTFNVKRENFPAVDFKSIDRLFSDQAEKTPGKIAVSSPRDLRPLYEALKSPDSAANANIFNPVCFKQNIYIFQKDLNICNKNSKNNRDFKLVKTQRHNSVIVNGNLIKLLALFDGKHNAASIFSYLEQFRDQDICFFILSMKENDLLEVRFRFNDKADIFRLAQFETVDFVSLVKILYHNHLINLFDVNARELPFETCEPEYFEKNESYDRALNVGRLLDMGSATCRQADVLLLGDTPGIPSTGLLYIASYLIRKGIKACCRFYDDAQNYRELKKSLWELLQDIRPKVVGVSMKWFLYISRVIDICTIVKEYARRNCVEIKVVVGGNTAAYYCDEIINYDCIDYVVRGDGEEPFLRICRGEASIPNCLFKREGKIVKSPFTYIQDKTVAAGIYLSHLDEILLSRQAPLFGTFFIYTHKGCAMNCLYCGGCNRAQQKTFNREQVYRRGVGEVRKDIRQAKEYASTFQFDFDIPDAGLVDYCRQTWDGIDLTGHFCIFACLTLPDEKLVELVSRTFNFVYWDMDITTLSERHRLELVSKKLVKPQPTDEEILRFLELCDKYANIEVRLNLINGLPYFTIEDLEPSEKLLSRILSSYNCFGELHWARLHAQPGAPVVRDAEKYGMYSYAVTFEDFMEYSRKNFDRETSYPELEFMDYPYIYFRDKTLNSLLTRFYSENNLKIERYRENSRENRLIGEVLSYGELNRRADRLAGLLKKRGVTPGSIAALLTAPAVETAVGILGILKAGAAYLPIDPQFPRERIVYMLRDSSASVLITKAGLPKEVETPASWQGRVLLFAEVEKNDTGAAGTGSDGLTAPHNPGNAYIIYTSGSTGKPKGVMLSHKNLVNYVNWFTTETGLSQKDKTVLTSSFAFDLGYTAIYPSLLCGGELHLPARQDYLLPERLFHYLTEKEITYIKMTPSLFALLVNHPGFTGRKCKSLRFVVLGGEPINLKDIRKVHEHFPHTRVMNHYGPTEATIGCVATFVDFDAFEAYIENPVIGKPIPGTAVNILDKNLNLLPIGVPGELCISGACLARGYVNRPELTAEKFTAGHLVRTPTPPPLRPENGVGELSVVPGTNELSTYQLIYKTGDLARRLPDGTIEFLGRIDNQVKIRGYRIELEEIAKRLLTHPEVEEAVVIDREIDSGEKYLCAYLIKRAGHSEVLKGSDLTGKISRLKGIFGDAFTGQEKVEKNRNIVKSFEDQVKRAPGKTALKSGKEHLTYESLNSWADRAADRVRAEYDDRFSLSRWEKERYKRQMLLYDWGTASQEKLKSTTVFVAGAGGGASPTIVQLALAGIGTIKVCDFDEVELSNLNRQFLHDEERIGMNKALSAQLSVAKINPHVNVIPYTGKLTRENVFELVGDSAVIFDMLDGPADKFVLSECAAVMGIPHLVLSMTDINAYAALLKPPDSPCYYCLFDKEKLETIVAGMQSRDKNYKKNPLAVVSSSLFTASGFLVTEALKILLGFENPAYNRFFYFNHRGGTRDIALSPGYTAMTHLFSDHFLNLCKKQGFDWDTGWRGKFLDELTLEANPACPLCSEKGKEKLRLLQERMQEANPVSSSYIIGEDGAAAAHSRAGGEDRKSVALLSDSDAVTAAGIIAAMKSAKSYGLLEPEEPESRLIEQLEDSQARIILTQNKHFALARKLRDAVNTNIRVIDIGQLNDFAAAEELSGSGAVSLTTELREYLQRELPDYMIPTYFVLLPEMPLTGNGKIDRDALPVPGKEVFDNYTPPGNELEETLAAAWQEILGVAQIGIHDNFFELGLDSIKAIQVSSRLLQKGFNVEVRDIFEHPTINRLAGSVSFSGRPIDQETVRGEVPLTPIQHWFFSTTSGSRSHFNMALMLYNRDGFDERILEHVFDRLTVHHDALRMVFRWEGNKVRQWNRGVAEKAFEIEVLEVKGKGNFTAKEIEKAADRIQRSLDLEKGPLVKLGVFKTGAGDHLLIVVHHLLIDGISWRILLEDLNSGYYRAQRGEEPVFPAKTDSYKAWAETLTTYSGGTLLLKELGYWKSVLDTEVKPLPVDDNLTAGKMRKYGGNETITLSLDEKETGKLLREVHRAYNTGINDILLTALIRALYEWRGVEMALIDLEGHGRENINTGININRTIGWFTSLYPVLLRAHKDTARNIKSVKEILRSIPNNGIGYGVLKYLTPEDRKKGLNVGRNAEINFNFLGQFGGDKREEKAAIGMSPLKYGETNCPDLENPYLLGINGLVTGGKTVFYIRANKNEYKRESIAQFASHFRANLVSLIDHCLRKKEREYTPSDYGYTGLSIDELEEIGKKLKKREGRKVEIESISALSPNQYAFLQHSLENKAQRTQTILTLSGNIDRLLFREAYDLLVKRYDALRSLFFYKNLTTPVTIVLKERKLPVCFEDISGLDREEKQRYAAAFKEKDWEKGFDLGREVMRVSLLKLAEDRYEMIWSIHRTVVDGWCIGLIYGDFIRFYLSLKDKIPVEPEPVTPYREYVAWLEKQDRQEWLHHWQNYLKDFQKASPLPGANKPGKAGDFRLGEWQFELDEQDTVNLDEAAKINNVTLNTIYQCIWGILLQKYNHSNDVVFGATVNGRPPQIAGIEHMVGLFVNTVPVRIRKKPGDTFRRLLAEAQKGSDAARPYEYAPAAEVVGLSPVKRDLITSNIVFQNYPFQAQLKKMKEQVTKEKRSIDIGFMQVNSEFHVQTNFAVNIFIYSRGRFTTVEFNFNSCMYAPRQIKKVAADFQDVIKQIINKPGINLDEIKLTVS